MQKRFFLSTFFKICFKNTFSKNGTISKTILRLLFQGRWMNGTTYIFFCIIITLSSVTIQHKAQVEAPDRWFDPKLGWGAANFGAPLDPWRSFSRSTLSLMYKFVARLQILLLLCDLRHPKQTMYKFVVCAKWGVHNLDPKIFEILLLSCDLRHRNQAMYKFVVWSTFWSGNDPICEGTAHRGFLL